jgi:hypothetical protein
MMKRGLLLIAVIYIAAALSGRMREARGDLTCECERDCWCKQPGLSLFRWVFPIGHSLPRSGSA